MPHIPLYNCYWCKCAWCSYAIKCNDRECCKCYTLDKKGKIPYLRESCDKFIPKEKNIQWLVDMVQKCDTCNYKRALNLLLQQLGKPSL